MKKSQLVMVWFLPLIVIGGLFFPLLGYLVVGMMGFFLVLSFFAGRYWCWNLCPRGAFLDIVVSKVSRKKPFPGYFLKSWFRWSVFFIFALFLGWRIMLSGGDIFLIGAVFAGACLITTVISLILGAATKQRAWCAFCPMGLLQEKIGKLKK